MLQDLAGKDHTVSDRPGSEEDGREIPDRRTWFRGDGGNAPMFLVNLGSRSTRGDSMVDPDLERDLANPNHPIWRIILLCLLILGGGTVASDLDIISVSGL